MNLVTVSSLAATGRMCRLARKECRTAKGNVRYRPVADIRFAFPQHPFVRDQRRVPPFILPVGWVFNQIDWWTFALQQTVSALLPKANIVSAQRNVRYGPQADMARPSRRSQSLPR